MGKFSEYSITKTVRNANTEKIFLKNQKLVDVLVRGTSSFLYGY